MKTNRKWATPVTAGAFVLMALTGLLMFFHFDRGSNHLVHEWAGLILVLAVAFHLSANFSNFKKHISSRIGLSLIAVFVMVFLLSFLQFEEKKTPPNWAGPIRALAEMPLIDLANLAKINFNELREKLKVEKIIIDSKDQSIQDLVGPNLRRQAFALKLIFPFNDE